MRFLDANIFVRYLALDEPTMSEASRTLLRSIASGQEQARVLDATIAEVVHVLGSRRLYGMDRGEIAERMQALLAFRSIQMTDKSRCLHALRLYGSYPFLDFADALLSAATLDEEPHEVWSFDRDFDRVAGITRLEPATA
jgi:predicted nucleic acid-binding protein